MYIIVAGCRKIGSNLARMLSQDNHDVVVIDSDPTALEALGSGFNGVTIAGMPIDEDVLRSAGIEEADALAAVTSNDNMNVMISQIARDLFHVPKVITRLYDPVRETVFHQMGLTVICPTTLAINKIKSMLIPNEKIETLEVGNEKISFYSRKPSKKMVGRGIKELIETHVFGLIRNGHLIFPCSDVVIEENDKVIFAEYADQDGALECI
ncbi:MAG: potassium channel family protein [Christensenellales bacterium]